MNKIVYRYCVPLQITSENESVCNSSLVFNTVDPMKALLNINHIKTTPRNSKGNGQIKRYIRSFTEQLLKWTEMAKPKRRGQTVKGSMVE